MSADGLGNVSLDLTDEDGQGLNHDARHWSVHMEREDVQDRWTLDTSATPFTLQQVRK